FSKGLRLWSQKKCWFGAKPLDAMPAAEEIRSPFEFDGSRGGVCLDGHTANGIDCLIIRGNRALVVHRCHEDTRRTLHQKTSGRTEYRCDRKVTNVPALQSGAAS